MYSRLLTALLVAAALAGCAQKPPYEISQADREHYSDGVIRVERPGQAPLIEGVRGCIVYKAVYENQQISDWKPALAADWGTDSGYPGFMTGCVNESIAYKNGEVHVYLCALAIGAGGGCTNGGYYRSKTGERPWLTSWDQKHWENLPQ